LKPAAFAFRVQFADTRMSPDRVAWFQRATSNESVPGTTPSLPARGPPQPMTLRTTHVYRYTRAKWHLVHRHADFPPSDQRLARAA